jgi:hypothetical protein
MDAADSALTSVLLPQVSSGANGGRISSAAPLPVSFQVKDPAKAPTSAPGDVPDYDRGTMFGGVRVSRMSRQPQFLEQLPRYRAAQLRVWRCLHGPLEQDDFIGRSIHLFCQIAVLLFVILVVLETEDSIYRPNKKFFNISATVLASIITLDWVSLSHWP